MRDIGLAGIEVYDILRDEYDIQVEFGDIGNILAIVSVGDTPLAVERLVTALTQIKRRYSRDPAGMFDHEYITPLVKLPPRRAFYAAKRVCAWRNATGVCAENLSCATHRGSQFWHLGSLSPEKLLTISCTPRRRAACLPARAI